MKLGASSPLWRVTVGIGRGEIGDICDRHAGDFEPCVLEVDGMRLLILDDLGGANLPQRRPFRMGFARLAGGIHALLNTVTEPSERSMRGEVKRVRLALRTWTPSAKPEAKSSVRSNFGRR